MHAHSQNAAGNWDLAGPGSPYSFRSYPDTIHHGYGWGRMIDSDFFSGPLVSTFHRNAVKTTKPGKTRKEIKYPLSWH